jgi:hypothetical protein
MPQFGGECVGFRVVVLPGLIWKGWPPAAPFPLLLG